MIKLGFSDSTAGGSLAGACTKGEPADGTVLAGGTQSEYPRKRVLVVDECLVLLRVSTAELKSARVQVKERQRKAGGGYRPGCRRR